MMLANDCPLNDAANKLGMSTYELLRLAETRQIDVCFVHRWGTEPVRFIRKMNDTMEVIERGVLLPFGNALVCPSHADLSAIFRDGVAEITGGISYDSSSEDETEWLLWANPRRVTAADLVVPQYEVEALKKVGEFHEWVEGFEPVQVNAATAASQHDDYDRARDETLPKGVRQREAIAWAIRVKEFDPMAVTDGEKGTLEALCRAEYADIFAAETAFKNAWQAGIGEGLWRIASHASYGKRGKV